VRLFLTCWRLSARTSDLFGVEFDAPILAHDELYAGKLVTALDWQQHAAPSLSAWLSVTASGASGGPPKVGHQLAAIPAFSGFRSAASAKCNRSSAQRMFAWALSLRGVTDAMV
jgi:hypothetical protein